MLCPVCDYASEGNSYNDFQHLMGCGVFNKRLTTEGLLYLYCVCGFRVGIVTFADAIIHVRSQPHDWKRLIVRAQMEEM